MHNRWKLVKNSAANLARGSAAAVAALVLPPLLVRHMGALEFGVWALVLQIAAYVGYLDFGLQAAIGRYVAFATEKHDTETRDGIYSTALTGLSLGALAGFVLILLAAAGAPHFFHSVPHSLIGPMRWATVIVGLSMSLSLPASACNGVFVGLQRYELPALTVGGAKLLSALGLIVAAIEGKSLVTMAIILAGVNIVSYVAQAGILHWTLPNLRFRFALIKKATIRELSGYCASLTVWSFSMLLVNGFDLILVGRFEFKAVAVYAVSATLVTFLAGSQNAIFGVIMPHAAALQAHGDSKALGRLLISSTRLGVLFLLATGLPLIVFAFEILKVWIGLKYAYTGEALLVILLVANMVRLIGTPFASILIGTGEQRLIIIGPLMEGVTNLADSILLGMRYGAIGVAWGTLLGAIVGITSAIFYNTKRTEASIGISSFTYLLSGILVPAACGIPAYLAFVYSAHAPHISAELVVVAMVISVATCVLMGVRSVSDRHKEAY